MNPTTPVELAEAVGGPTTPFRASKNLSSHFGWFADDDCLTVVCVERPQYADLALAYGLAWAVDRDLRLVLPEGAEAATVERAAFLSVPVEVWTHGVDGVQWQRPLTQREVLGRFREELKGQARHELGERAEWIRPLIDWADTAAGVTPAHRQSYMAWHCLGRQVLRIQRTGKGIAIIAGKNWGTPPPDELAPVRKELLGTATPAELMRLLASAAYAAADRLEGKDSDHPEHAFQAMLPMHARAFGFREMRREFPARRAGGGPAFVDFLAVGLDNRIRAVETKLGGDPMLGLQALDSAIWSAANRQAIGDVFGVERIGPPAIDIVVGAKQPGGPTIGPYTAAQLEAIDGSIPWWVWEVDGWHDGEPTITTAGRRRLPAVTPRVGEARWAWRLQRHLSNAVGKDWYDDASALGPAAQAVYEELESRKALHGFALHVRSSQAFALRLFAPLDDAGLMHLAAGVTGGEYVEVERLGFEWSDPADRPREATPASPHRTAVDFAFRAVDRQGRRHLFLVEVKLTEEDFESCSAWAADGNDSMDLCDVSGPFGNDTGRCFQLRNKDNGQRRLYDVALGPLTAAGPAHGGCWWRFGGNQPMRNAALAAVLVRDGEADAAHVVLCAPLAHRVVWRRWEQAKQRLAGVPGVALDDLPAERIIEHHPDVSSPDLRHHYLLADR